MATITSNGTGQIYINCTFVNNGRHSYTSHVIFYNCAFGYSQSDIIYINTGSGSFGYCESFDHNQSAGAYKRWTLGGNIASQVSVLPSGYSIAYIHTLSSALYYNHRPVRFIVPAGESVSVEVQLRKDASMAYLPRVYLMNGIENLLVDPTTAEDSFTMTDSTDTWESDTFTIDNSAGTTDKDYTLWFVGQNASGNVYSAYKITNAKKLLLRI